MVEIPLVLNDQSWMYENTPVIEHSLLEVSGVNLD
jgi:hypothetical protein